MDGGVQHVAGILQGRTGPLEELRQDVNEDSPKLPKWQPGEERFVLHVFEEPASTPDELKIAVYLAHKLPDTTKLKAIAEDESPHATYAREALAWIDRQRGRDK
jgi:hypothetical protein